MSADTNDIRTALIKAALPSVIFDGWTMAVMEQAAIEAEYSPDMVRAVFPEGLPDVLDFFAAWLDGKMLAALADIDPATLRVRERIKVAVTARFQAMQEHREAERLALRYWSRPDRQPRAARLVWRTADKIWHWAGDESKDYNYYTKRGLLSGVIGASTLAWLNDDSADLQATERFIERRIGNVLKLGGFIGRFKKRG